MEAMIGEEVMIKKIPRTAMEVFELLPTGTLCEVINNTLYMSPAPTPKHQRLSGQIHSAFARRIEESNLRGELFVAPIDVYLDGENAFQPDLLYIESRNLAIIDWEKGIMGAPDFVIEILSKGNPEQKMDEKKAVYEKHGVQEFWIINEKTKQSKQYWLQDGRFIETVFEGGEIYFKLLDVGFKF